MGMLSNGQPIASTGWYEDQAGHRLFLQTGKLAPICPRHGLTGTRWRLLAAVEAAPLPAQPPNPSGA